MEREIDPEKQGLKKPYESTVLETVRTNRAKIDWLQ